MAPKVRSAESADVVASLRRVGWSAILGPPVKNANTKLAGPQRKIRQARQDLRLVDRAKRLHPAQCPFSMGQCPY
jgi:hypothetical protein